MRKAANICFWKAELNWHNYFTCEQWSVFMVVILQTTNIKFAQRRVLEWPKSECTTSSGESIQ